MTLVRANYRGRSVSLAGGLAVVALLLVGAWWFPRPLAWLAGVGLSGLVGVYDDLRGSSQARGLRGHLRSLLAGRVTSGLVKLLVIGVAALLSSLVLFGLSARAAVAAVLVAGLANLVNLFDLRPGRALKVSLLLALSVLAWWVVLVCLAVLPFDLRERVMLGDGGANALGAACGLCLARAASLPVASVLAVLVVVLTLVSERVSFTRVIDATPALRWADRLGRAA